MYRSNAAHHFSTPTESNIAGEEIWNGVCAVPLLVHHVDNTTKDDLTLNFSTGPGSYAHAPSLYPASFPPLPLSAGRWEGDHPPLPPRAVPT